MYTVIHPTGKKKRQKNLNVYIYICMYICSIFQLFAPSDLSSPKLSPSFFRSAHGGRGGSMLHGSLSRDRSERLQPQQHHHRQDGEGRRSGGQQQPEGRRAVFGEPGPLLHLASGGGGGGGRPPGH